MKKFGALIVSFIALSSLTGCSESRKIYLGNLTGVTRETVDFSTAELSDFTVSIDADQIVTYISGKEDFLLYIGHTYCSACTSFRPALIEYVYRTNNLVYYFNAANDDSQAYARLASRLPDFFPEDGTVPTLYFFKQGKLNEVRTGTRRMFKYSTLKPLVQSYVNYTNIYYVFSPTVLANLVKERATVLYLRRSDIFSMDMYRNHLFDYMRNMNNLIYIYDVDRNPFALDSSFAITYGLTRQDTGVVVRYQNNQIIASATFNGTNGDELLTFIRN